MTIKGITRTCYGDTFDSEEEIRKMATSYHKVLVIMCVCVGVTSSMDMCIIMKLYVVNDQF